MTDCLIKRLPLISNLTKGFYNEISLLKVFAFLLVTWFHLKYVAPENLQSFFLGGSIGNGIFMYCSGYLFHLKSERFLGQWVFQKWFRMFPSIWIFLLLGMIWTFPAITFKWFNFVYPSNFWFVDALLIYFVVSYIFKKLLNNDKLEIEILFVGACGLMCLFFFQDARMSKYVIMDYGGKISWSMYFLSFLLGRWIRGKKLKTRPICWLFFLLSFFSYFGYKYIAEHFNSLLIVQIVAMPFFLNLTIVLFHCCCIRAVNFTFLKKISFVVLFLSNITLELYVVQVFLIHQIGPFFTFPISLFLLFALVITVAAVVHVCADAVRLCLTKTASCMVDCFEKKS